MQYYYLAWHKLIVLKLTIIKLVLKSKVVTVFFLWFFLITEAADMSSVVSTFK